MDIENLSLNRNRYAMKNSTSLVNHVVKSLIVIREFFLSPLTSLIAWVLFFAERIKIVFFLIWLHSEAVQMIIYEQIDRQVENLNVIKLFFCV